MVVNFRIREINRGTCKLAGYPQLIKENINKRKRVYLLGSVHGY